MPKRLLTLTWGNLTVEYTYTVYLIKCESLILSFPPSALKELHLATPKLCRPLT